jgi:hypothetical protein
MLSPIFRDYYKGSKSLRSETSIKYYSSENNPVFLTADDKLYSLVYKADGLILKMTR